MVSRLAVLTLCAGVLCSACASTGSVPRPFPGASVPPRPGPERVEVPPAAGSPIETPDPFRAEVVATALVLRGIPYRNGGSDPSGFDCSGFVQYVFAQHATRLPREAQEQYHAGDAIARSEIQPGDLVFFHTVSNGPSHVGLAIGGDQFVHAPSSRGVVRIESISADYWASRFIGARRIVDSTSSR